MGSYSQWCANKKFGRVNWVFGPESVLKSDVTSHILSASRATAMDCHFFDAATDSAEEIWATARHFSLLGDSPRFVEVTNAEKLAPGALDSWLKQYSGSGTSATLVLVSDVEPTVAAMRSPKAVVVKCAMPKSADRLAWTVERGGLSRASAKKVVEFKNGDLEGIASLCWKLKSLVPDSSDLDISVEMLQSLEEETPSDFVSAVLARDKPRAYTSAARLSRDSMGKILGSLDYHLLLLDKLSDALQASPRGQKMEPIPGFPMGRLAELAPLARSYTFADTVKCRQVITLMDSYYRQGATEALLEALVTLW